MKDEKTENEIEERTDPETVEMTIHSDDRGFLMALTQELPEDLQAKVKRTYIVSNYSKGTIRGLHFHQFETKIFYIVQGAAKFIALDPENPENCFETILNERSNRMLIVPPKFANGWMSLTDNTILVAMSTSTFEESARDDKRYEPYEFGDLWKVEAR